MVAKSSAARGRSTAFPPMFIFALTLAIGQVVARAGAILNIGRRPGGRFASRRPVQTRPRRSSTAAVSAPEDAGSGHAPPVWAVELAVLTRELSARTWRGCRVKSECEAAADSDWRGTGAYHHGSRSALTTIPTRPATAIAKIRSARQSAAKWNQPAIAQSTARRRAGASQIDDAPQESQSGDSAVPKPRGVRCSPAQPAAPALPPGPAKSQRLLGARRF
jgi:hypothetical protein